MKKRGERILGPYEQHNGWRVVMIDANGKRSSVILETEAKATRFIELLCAELAKDDLLAKYKPSPVLRDPEAGWVYFIQSVAGPVKIGRTRNLPARFRLLQSSSPEALQIVLAYEIEDEIAEEARLHRMFDAARISPRREWFRATDALRRFVEEARSDLERQSRRSAP
jgi:Meiotically Up-regulated Gene 113 (MUG113) protein